MINGKLTDFVDSLYYGQEMVFIYQDVKYFVQGWWSDDKSTATLVLDIMNKDPFSGYLWEHHGKSMMECAEAFLAAPIWEGKNFIQVEADVNWVD